MPFSGTPVAQDRHRMTTRKVLTLLLLAVASTVSAASTADVPAAPARPVNVAIVAYHEVEAVPKMGWAAREEDFNDQLRYLARTGYHVIPLNDLYDYIAGRRQSLPPNPIVITVDDGWRCTYDTMFPAFERYRFPFSLFVYPKILGVGSHAMTWSQVQELAAKGVDIESHTMSHPHLMRRSQTAKSDEEYLAWLRSELTESRALLAEKTGKPVVFLAYPYGDHDSTVEAESAKAGYLAALTSEVGLNTRGSDPMALRRLPITSDTTLDAFRRGIGAASLELYAPSPADGTVIASGTRKISATIANAAILDPSTVHIALLNDTKTAASFDPVSGTVTLALNGPLKGARQQVVVWGDDAYGRRYAGGWTLYASEKDRLAYEAQANALAGLPLHHTQKTRRQ
jgi:peptidoglycan/xylan/chitin deacetylase (PgdA/CDA1 family)